MSVGMVMYRKIEIYQLKDGFNYELRFIDPFEWNVKIIIKKINLLNLISIFTI